MLLGSLPLWATRAMDRRPVRKPMISKRRSHREWCVGSQGPVDSPSRARQRRRSRVRRARAARPVALDVQLVQTAGAVAGRFAVAPFGSPR